MAFEAKFEGSCAECFERGRALSTPIYALYASVCTQEDSNIHSGVEEILRRPKRLIELPDHPLFAGKKYFSIHNRMHILPTALLAFYTDRRRCYPQQFFVQTFEWSSMGPGPKRAKRLGCWRTKPLLIRSLDHTVGGTLIESTNGRAAAALAHLKILRERHRRQDAIDRLYVTLAFVYGVPVYEIAEITELPLDRVQSLIAGK